MYNIKSNLFLLVFFLLLSSVAVRGQDLSRSQFRSVEESLAVERIVAEQILAVSSYDESAANMTSNLRVSFLRKLIGDRAKIVSLSERLERSSSALLADLAIWQDKLRAYESIDLDRSFGRELGPAPGMLEQLARDRVAIDESTSLIENLTSSPSADPESPISTNGSTQMEVDLMGGINSLPYTDISVSSANSLNELSMILTDVRTRIDRETIRQTEEFQRMERQESDRQLELDVAKANVDLLLDRTGKTETFRADLASSLRALDATATSLLDTELERSRYTSNATIVFGALVGIVIIGFFVVALMTPTLRSAMLGGEKGIQFIALFSIIIAIILFGILGILEGKELSALLGGLSGYILGRGVDGVPRAILTTQTDTSTAQPTQQEAQTS